MFFCNVGANPAELIAMPLRQMQIFLTSDHNVDLDKLFEGRDVLGTWRDAKQTDRVALYLLVPAEETEAIMDRLEESFGQQDGFHVVLSTIEAVLPREKLEEEQNNSATDEAQDAGRISREELYEEISSTLGVNRVFMALSVLASVVAAVGLLRDDVAVIVGAMVIAPLLGPTVAMSFAVTLGDVSLMRRAALTSVVGLALTIVVALLVGLIVEVDPATPAIASRTSLSWGAILLSLAAGAAGTFAFTRGMSGAVLGVTVAVALVPPLAACGMLVGAGHWPEALGALWLVLTNVICINLAGAVTFVAQGVRPRTWWEEKRARRSTITAIAIWLVLLAVLSAVVYIAEQ